MHIPAYQRTLERFDEHDGFVRAAIGLVSLLLAFDRILDRHAPPASTSGSRAPAAPERADEVENALLGAIALKSRISAHFETIATSGGKLETPEAFVTPGKRVDTGGLLR